MKHFFKRLFRNIKEFPLFPHFCKPYIKIGDFNEVRIGHGGENDEEGWERNRLSKNKIMNSREKNDY